MSPQAAALKLQVLASQREANAQNAGNPNANPVGDDRDNLQPGDRKLLIVEDDEAFARILLDTARRQGFKGLVAVQGDIALAMASEYAPDAITLDLQLPLLDGWTVLDHLKRDPATRHIPVQVISVIDKERGSLVKAISYLEKPVSREAIEGALAHMKSFAEREVRELLVVEDDETQRASIASLIGDMDVRITAVGTGEEALSKMKASHFDCMILDLGLPDMAGFDLLKKVKRQARHRDLPVIIYTGRDLSKQEETQLKKYAATIIAKDGESADKLLEDTALFLHRLRKTDEPNPAASTSTPPAGIAIAPTALPEAPDIVASSPEVPASSTPAAQASTSGSLGGRKVLVVDDDVRNIFALTSVLEDHGATVLFAENGREGIEVLEATPGIDIVLMDVMMPEMDGYETIEAIRAGGRFPNLPIISLTAKAMAGDREKCMESGASDYITKPVDIEALVAAMERLLGGR